MLKEPDLARYSTRRAHRTYTRQFKAELVAACQQPGASIAAIARVHGMNANVLHRWLKEHEQSGGHQLVAENLSDTPLATSPVSFKTVVGLWSQHSCPVDFRQERLIDLCSAQGAKSTMPPT